MGRQDDELVPVVTVALSITVDIPGGHVSQRLIKAGKFNKEAKTVVCNKATPKPQTCSTGRTFKVPLESQESSKDTITGDTNTKQSAGLHLNYAAVGGFPCPLSLTDFHTEHHLDKHFLL